MDATSTGPQHFRRQWGENRAYNRTLDNNNVKKRYTDRYVKLAVNHTTNLLRRVFCASIRLHDCLTSSCEVLWVVNFISVLPSTPHVKLMVGDTECPLQVCQLSRSSESTHFLFLRRDVVLFDSTRAPDSF